MAARAITAPENTEIAKRVVVFMGTFGRRRQGVAVKL